MIGTTRSRVSFFMNRFRKLGFVNYGEGGLQVHSSLLNLVLPRLELRSEKTEPCSLADPSHSRLLGEIPHCRTVPLPLPW